MFLTFCVSKLDKSIDFKLLHPWNIPVMLSIVPGWKFFNPTEVKEVQKFNTKFNFLRLFGLKLSKLTYSNELHPSKILSKSVTFSPPKFDKSKIPQIYNDKTYLSYMKP